MRSASRRGTGRIPALEPDLHPVEASGRAGLPAVRRLHPGHRSMSRKQVVVGGGRHRVDRAGRRLLARLCGTSPLGGAGMSAEAFFAQTFNDLDGQPTEMARWKDRIVVVNFWATWCPPCVEEMPDLQRVHDEYADRGVTVVGLGIDSPSALKRFRDEHGFVTAAVRGRRQRQRARPSARQPVGRAAVHDRLSIEMGVSFRPASDRSGPPNFAAGWTLKLGHRPAERLDSACGIRPDFVAICLLLQVNRLISRLFAGDGHVRSGAGPQRTQLESPRHA